VTAAVWLERFGDAVERGILTEEEFAERRVHFEELDRIAAARANGSVPAPDWVGEEPPPSTRQLRFLPGRAFVEQKIERRPALLGDDDDSVLPAHGLAIVGGEGGSGKSTLTLHGIAHLGTATPWLGIPIDRALRIGVIENEGPKAPFIDKVKRFAEAWPGDDFLERCFFLDSPWGRFTLADEGLRAELRSFALDNELDLLIAGPLGRLGLEGVGSPDETRAFLDLLGEIGCQRDLAVWLLHHINKARHRSIVQALSGDWGGHPDLILGLEHEEGQRRTRLTFGKVRWGDQGRRPLVLDWLPAEEGIGYRVNEAASAAHEGQRNQERVLEAIRAGSSIAADVAASVGLSKRTVNRHFGLLEQRGLVQLTAGAKGAKIAVPVGGLELDEGAEGHVAVEELEWR
jgi:AAA domain